MVAVSVKMFWVLMSTYIMHSVCGDVFYGSGKVIYSHRWKYIDSGIEISYRPENYGKYSSEIDGVVRLAKLAFAQAYTYTAAKRDTDRKSMLTDSHVMTWSSKGKYYYYIGSEDLEIGKYISMRIQLHDSRGETIYRTSGTYAISFSNDCEVETSMTSVSNPCSGIFNDARFYEENINEDTVENTPNDGDNDKDHNDTEDDNDGITSGGLAAAISIPLIIVVLIVIVIAVILVRRQNSLVTSNGNQPPYNNGNQHHARFSQSGQVNLAVSQSSAVQHTASMFGEKEERYEIPLHPQTSNIYEVLRPPRSLPPPPPPQHARATKQTIQHGKRHGLLPLPTQPSTFESQATQATTSSEMYCGPEASAPPAPKGYRSYDDITVGHPDYYPSTECQT